MRYAHSSEKDSIATPTFHSVAIIGVDGREITITEKIVSQLLFALHDQWSTRTCGQQQTRLVSRSPNERRQRLSFGLSLDRLESHAHPPRVTGLKRKDLPLGRSTMF